MDTQQYDVIVCGTGIKECLLSCLLAQSDLKVLQIDRNSYYGGESPTLNFIELWQKFRGQEQLPNYYDQNYKSQWNVDLTQKFILSQGNFCKLLQQTMADRFIDWKTTDTTLIYQKNIKEYSGLCQYPITPAEVQSSTLNEQEKERIIKFYSFVKSLDPQSSNTGYYCNNKDLQLQNVTFKEFIKSFELENTTIEFIGHLLGQFNIDPNYLPALKVVKRIQKYLVSYGKFNENSFIYPVFGNSVICEAISRCMAIQGSSIMLNFEISDFSFHQNGKVSGVQPSDKFQQEMSVGQLRCNYLVADSTYILNSKLSHRQKLVGRIVRCICVLNHKIPNTTMNSGFIVIPGLQVGRKNDIHISIIDSSFQICQKGLYVCQIQTNAETDQPEQELQPAFEIIGETLDKFIEIKEDYQPVDNFQDNVFITSPLDSLGNLEQDIEQVLDIYKCIIGENLKN